MSEQPPIWSACSYDGVARSLITSMKFGRLAGLAGVMSDVIARTAPSDLLAGTLTPVPPSPARRRSRGFDPATLLAAGIAECSGFEMGLLLERDHGPRQASRDRGERVADPPVIRTRLDPPATVVVVDDVVTTGATLRACARALQSGGCEDVRCVTFAWTPVRGTALGATLREA